MYVCVFTFSDRVWSIHCHIHGGNRVFAKSRLWFAWSSRTKLLLLLFISHYQLIRYESSRGPKIDGGTEPNQNGNFGDKQGKQTEENGQESSHQRIGEKKNSLQRAGDGQRA